MDAEAKRLVAAYAAKVEELDDDLIEAPTRHSLLKWLDQLPDDEAAVALEMLAVAFDADDADTSTMLSLIDKRLARHISWLGTTCTLFLELLVSGALWDPQAMTIIDALRHADHEGRRRILSTLPVPNRGLRSAHEVFRAAWESCPRDAHYRERIHRGEPTPALKAITLLELVVFVAEHVASLVPAAEAGTFDTGVAFARNALATPANEVPRPRFRTWVGLDHPQTITQVCQEAAELYLSSPGSTGQAWIVAKAAKSATQLIAAGSSRPAAELRHFLLDLDEELRRLDVVTAVGKKPTSDRIARAIYRERNIWLARLANGNYGLLLKSGRRASWIDGGRDEVLGSIPDDHFEKAVLAAKELA